MKRSELAKEKARLKDAIMVASLDVRMVEAERRKWSDKLTEARAKVDALRAERFNLPAVDEEEEA